MMIAPLALLALVAAPAAGPRILSLEEALANARALQPQLRQASAAVSAGLARADEARAPLLPQVNGSAAYQRTTGNFTSRPGSVPRQVSGNGGAASWETLPFINLGVNASQLLYDFGQSRSRWRSAESLSSSLKQTEQATLEQVLLAVRIAYYQTRAAKGLVQVANDTLANQQKHLEQTQGFVEVGTQAPIALAQAKTGVANARVQLINAQNGYETAKAQLNLAMGVEGPTDYDVADDAAPAVDGEDGTTEGLVGEAVKARSELAALADQVAALKLALRAARGAYGPSLSLSTGLTDAGQQASSLAWNWNAGLTLSIPIFLGGQTRAQVSEAEANLMSAQAQLDQERQQVRLEVEQARLAVRAAKGAVTASAEALASAQEQLRLAEGRYQTGVGSIIELSDAQVALTTAAQQTVQSDYTLAQARAQLVRALGRD